METARECECKYLKVLCGHHTFQYTLGQEGVKEGHWLVESYIVDL